MKAGISGSLVLLLIIIIVACGCTGQVPPVKENPRTTTGPGTDSIPQGRGQFIFNDSLGNVDRPITVYTYRPNAWNSSGPVLIVMHGAGREGQSPRETWIPYAEQYSSLLVVPEFSENYYPGDQWYIGGNMFSSVGKVNPKSNWTYTAIEHLFDEIKNQTGARQNTYLLFGHSAGAQYVHRLVTFLPEARYRSAVAANAGFYLFPVYTAQAPTGLKNSPLLSSDLPKVFSRKLIIMSGEADINQNDGSLASFPEAEAEGKNRFERALAYYNAAKSEASRLSVPLNWEYHVVPRVGHDEVGMAGPSAAQLFTGA
jgi:predicted esterase